LKRIRPPFYPAKGVKAVDRGIEDEVRILWENGIETTESCQGGKGHPFSEPTVRFRGGHFEGLRAVAIAQANGLRVFDLRRVWSVQDGELVGPEWEITFSRVTISPRRSASCSPCKAASRRRR
jgi:hypothetical protein